MLKLSLVASQYKPCWKMQNAIGNSSKNVFLKEQIMTALYRSILTLIDLLSYQLMLLSYLLMPAQKVLELFSYKYPLINIDHLPTVAPVFCSLWLHHNQLIVRWFGMCTGPRLLGESILRV